MTDGLKYFFWVDKDDRNDSKLHVGDVSATAAAFIRLHVGQNLSSLDADTYNHGPLGLLSSAVSSVYIMDRDAVLWCTEWEPGLIVVRFSPGDEMRWAAFRDPRPDFADRTPLPGDSDDDANDNPLYSLIFDGWDAQNGHDPDHDLPLINARPATKDEMARFATAMNGVHAIAFDAPERDTPEFEAWVRRCYATIESFAGEGIRFWKAGRVGR